jgi:hypothetical protein
VVHFEVVKEVGGRRRWKVRREKKGGEDGKK